MILFAFCPKESASSSSFWGHGVLQVCRGQLENNSLPNDRVEAGTTASKQPHQDQEAGIGSIWGVLQPHFSPKISSCDIGHSLLFRSFLELLKLKLELIYSSPWKGWRYQGWAFLQLLNPIDSRVLKVKSKPQLDYLKDFLLICRFFPLSVRSTEVDLVKNMQLLQPALGNRIRFILCRVHEKKKYPKT